MAGIDDIADSMPPFDLTDLDAAVAAFDALLSADDISFNERQALCTGFMGGMTFAIAAFKQGGEALAAHHLQDRMDDWASKGWID